MTATTVPDRARPLAGVTAGAAMHPGVLTIAFDAPLTAVARIMVAHGVHAVLVRPADPRELGWPSQVLTDRDLVRWVADGEPPAVAAADAASDRAGLLALDAPLDRAAQLMTELAEPHVLVADNHSRFPDGVLSSFDLAAVVGGHGPSVARLVRIGPARPASSKRGFDRVAIRDAMHSGVITCRPDTPVADVAASLAAHRVHCVVVVGVDAGRLVWKTVDTMDVVRATRRWDPALTAADIARHDPVALDENETMLVAARAMAERSVDHAVAVDATGHPTGVVSSLDVAGVCAVA